MKTFRWLILLPFTLLVYILSEWGISSVFSSYESYIINDVNTYYYYLEIIKVIIINVFCSYLLAFTSYFTAPSFKKNSTIVVFLIFLFLFVLSNFYSNPIEFSKEYIYITFITLVISFIISLKIIDNNSEKEVLLKLFPLPILINFLTVVFWTSSIILHFWTVSFAYKQFGLFGGVLSMFTPIISEIFYVIKLWTIEESFIRFFFSTLVLYFIMDLISKTLFTSKEI